MKYWPLSDIQVLIAAILGLTLVLLVTLSSEKAKVTRREFARLQEEFKRLSEDVKRCSSRSSNFLFQRPDLRRNRTAYDTSALHTNRKSTKKKAANDD
jgi:hypothetical protein